MSRNNFIYQHNKKLFEARLQINSNSYLKINRLYNYNKTAQNSNISFINTTQPIINEESAHKQMTIQINDNINHNIKRNTLITRQIKSNRNKNIRINGIKNKSNILLNDKKDIFSLINKKYNNVNNIEEKAIINVNKKIIKNNSNNKSLSRKKWNNRNINENNRKNSNKSKKKFMQFNSMMENVKKINEKKLITKNNINNKLNNKDKNISIKKLQKKNIDFNRNEYSQKIINNNKYNSFIIDKIKKINYDKKSILNTFNNFYDYNISYKGKNININNKKLICDIRYTHKKLFNEKNSLNISNSNTFGKIKISKNNSTIKNHGNIINKKNKGNRNKTLITLDNKINHKTLKEKDIIKSRNENNVNKKLSYNNKLNRKYGTQVLISFNEPKNIKNPIYQEFGHIPNKLNFQSIFANKKNAKDSIKYLDINNEIITDNNAISTKSNDEFSSEINNKIKESSIKEESGILSINDIEDIICYNNMSDIKKEENYLFYNHDVLFFFEKHQKMLYNLFFDDNKNQNKSYRKSIIKKKEKIIDNSNKYKELKRFSYNHSSIKKNN